MGWVMAGAYWIVQFAAAGGSLLARAFFGVAGNLAATMPPPGLAWQAAGFEAILTFGLVFMVLNLARSFGPDLAVGNLSTWWVYLLGPVVGAVIAVGVAYVLRGPVKAQEAIAAMGTPLDQGT